MVDVVLEGGIGVVAVGGEEVACDDLVAGFLEDGFPEVVFPAAASGSVDHDDGGFGLVLDGGGESGEHEGGGQGGDHFWTQSDYTKLAIKDGRELLGFLSDPVLQPHEQRKSAKTSSPMCGKVLFSSPLRGALVVSALMAAGLGYGQLDVHKHVNKANWKLANQYTRQALTPYLYSGSVNPRWINDSDRFWYEWRGQDGYLYWLVDPAARKKEPLFDTAKMAALITEANYKPIDSTTLNLGNINFKEDEEHILTFNYDDMRYEYNRKTEVLKKLGEVEEPERRTDPNAYKNFSPDEKAYVYAQNHNLFYVEILDDEGEEESDPIQLTEDGEQYYSFGFGGFQRSRGNDGEQEARKTRARVTWSEDSKRFYVTRSDSREVKELFLVNSLSQPRPTLQTYKYAMPGEEDVTQIELFAFSRDTKKLDKLPIERYKDQRLFDIHFQDTTSDKLRFVRRDRLQRNLELVEMDLDSKDVKVLLTEKTENAFLERQNVRYLEDGGDFVWYSERTGWGHFYLYENDGTFKHALTSGPWRASTVNELEGEKGLMWVTGTGREEGENRYYRHLYKVKLDGSGVTLLNPGNADNSTSMSDSDNFIVNNASRIDMPTDIDLLDRNGKKIMDLEDQDISRLLMAGWQMPETFIVKAADGVNDIYGNMWKPVDFDASKKYPIIAYVYPGPQTESVSSTFTTSTSLQQLAQLGFIVIQIGNRGGDPDRSNAYHSFGYFNLRDYGLADKKAGIEELARKHSFIDVNRVGIYGHSGGGFMTGAALLLPPYNEFFKVGVSSAGNHDNNIYNQNWSEQHHGLREVEVEESSQNRSGNRGGRGTGRTFGPDPEYYGAEEAWLVMEGGMASPVQEQDKDDDDDEKETKFEIKVPANHELAANLKGHLLLVHGDMDNNVHPGGTVRLVDALIKQNKRFDFMIMPGQRHGFGPMQGYFQNMLMEYFCEHLMGDYYRGSADMNDKGDD